MTARSDRSADLMGRSMLDNFDSAGATRMTHEVRQPFDEVFGPLDKPLRGAALTADNRATGHDHKMNGK